MRTMAISDFGGPEVLRAVDLPRPGPRRGEVLVRVVAAGVDPIDCRIRAGRLRDRLPHAFPLVPGWDVAGVVEEFGEDTGRFRKGDRVWACARKPTVQWGCYAEYVVLEESGVALMPQKLLFEEAAACPVSALTAFQALFDRPGLGPDSTVLVHGAAGAAGHFAVQLARNAGARVLGSASAADQAFVLGLGATAAIDDAAEDFEEAARRHCPDGVDLVFDTIGGDTLRRSVDVLRRGGRLVSVVDPPDEGRARDRGLQAQFVSVRPDAERLGLLARQVDRGDLRAEVQKIHSLSDAAEAHRTVEQGHVRGKLVLNL